MKIITTYKNADGSPLTGLIPLITIHDITDMSTPILVIDAITMTEIGTGFYGYIFEGYEEGKEYTVYIDADSSIQGRYQYGTLDKIEFADALSDLDGVNIREAFNIILSVLAGRSAGGGTNQVTFTDIKGTKNRITANVDTLGNRSFVNIDKT
jgi:hypothetical protein